MSFDSFINKGSSYFAGKNANPDVVQTQLVNYYNLGGVQTVDLINGTWVPITSQNGFNTFNNFTPNPTANFDHLFNGNLEYNGDKGIFSIMYSISSSLATTNNNVAFAIFINTLPEHQSTTTQILGANYITATGTQLITLNPGDVISLQAFLTGTNDTLNIINSALSVFQLL